jgi:hypothetical protein
MAQTTNFDTLVGVMEKVVSSTNWNLVIAPSYAPQAVDRHGNKAQWGGTVAAVYKVSDYVEVGPRLDYIGGEILVGDVVGTLKADVPLFGSVTVTPFGIGGAGYPLSGSVGSPIGIIGAGAKVKVDVWSWGELGFGGAVEKFTSIKGNVYSGGISINIHKKKKT